MPDLPTIDDPRDVAPIEIPPDSFYLDEDDPYKDLTEEDYTEMRRAMEAQSKKNRSNTIVPRAKGLEAVERYQRNEERAERRPRPSPARSIIERHRDWILDQLAQSTLEKIALELHISDTRLSSWLREQGITKPPRPKKLPAPRRQLVSERLDEQHDEIERLAQQGVAGPEIAARLNVADSTLHLWLKGTSIKLHGKPGPKTKPVREERPIIIRQLEEQRDLIEQLVAQHLTQRQIAQEIGVSYASLKKWATRANIKTRPRRLSQHWPLASNADEVLKMRDAGVASRVIAHTFGVTDGAVKQFLSRRAAAA